LNEAGKSLRYVYRASENEKQPMPKIWQKMAQDLLSKLCVVQLRVEIELELQSSLFLWRNRLCAIGTGFVVEQSASVQEMGAINGQHFATSLHHQLWATSHHEEIIYSDDLVPTL
jgi:hypothetical protein